MKIAEMTGPGLDAIAIAERPLLPVPAGHVRIKVGAVSLNYRDVLIDKGFLPLDYPRIPLSDSAGEVVEVGAAVSRIGLGDRVCPIYYPDWINGIIAPEKFGANGVAASMAWRPSI
jgi:NADPH:quinone reductase-like Zn-dependent oxidoreductase